MKLLVLFSLCVAAVSADLICQLGGEFVCKVNCVAGGKLHGGKCDENGDCVCDTEEQAEPRTELVCLLGGTLACEINCLASQGHFAGHCDEKNDCICGDKTTLKEVAVEAKEDLACLRDNADNVCAAFCHFTTGKHEGYCTADKKCICGPRPEAPRTELVCLIGGTLGCEINCLASQGHFAGHCDENNDCICGENNSTVYKRSIAAKEDLACLRENPDAVCAAFCHWTTGKQEGYCTDEKKCICGPRPVFSNIAIEAKEDLACLRENPDEVCAAFCHWTTGKQEGYCTDEKKCICGPRPVTVYKRSIEAKEDLACLRENPDEVCAAFCHWTTGKQEGYCSDEKKCICGPRPAFNGIAIEAKEDLACLRENPDEVCAAFCHWTTGKQEGYCTDDKKCICGPRSVTERGLLCSFGGKGCKVKCKITGHKTGECNEDKKCICQE